MATLHKGEVRHQSGPSLTEYTYTGQFSYTGSFGLMFYNARWYDPYLKRFAQADSIVPPGVQGLDRYAYVNNSPMNYVDPSGHVTGNPCEILGRCTEKDKKDLWKDSDRQEIHIPHRPKAKDPDNEAGIPDLSDERGNDDDSGYHQIWKNNEDEWGCGNPDIGYVDSCVGQYTKYATFTFGTAIPNTVTGTLVGWHVSVTLDQYGEWYLGGGFDFGKNVFGVSASLVGGSFSKDQLPQSKAEEKEYIEAFLTENSIQYFIVPLFYVGGNHSPSIGTSSLEQGVGVPQGGIGWTYTIKISE